MSLTCWFARLLLGGIFWGRFCAGSDVTCLIMIRVVLVDFVSGSSDLHLFVVLCCLGVFIGVSSGRLHGLFHMYASVSRVGICETGRFKVVDFGGSCGWIFFWVFAFGPVVLVAYSIR